MKITISSNNQMIQYLYLYPHHHFPKFLFYRVNKISFHKEIILLVGSLHLNKYEVNDLAYDL